MADADLRVKAGTKPNSFTFKVPVEIWMAIFEQADTCSAAEEFTTDARVHNPIPCEPPKESSRITSDAIEVNLQTRLAVILVCKLWYTIGVGRLYSHLRMRPSALYVSLIEALMANEERCAHVSRLTIVVRKSFTSSMPNRYRYPFDEDTDSEEKDVFLRKASVLITCLPRLKVLVGPRTLIPSLSKASKGPLCHLEAIKLTGQGVPEEGGRTRSTPPTEMLLWQNVTVLSLSISNASFNASFSLYPLSFPSLLDLEIISFNVLDGVQTANRLSTPKLRSFSLVGSFTVPWANFCGRHTKVLEVLSQQSGSPLEKPDQIFFEFPRFRGMYVHTLQVAGWIRAPKLERLGIQGLGKALNRYLPPTVHDDHAMAAVMLAFDMWKAYPSVKHYYVVGNDTFLARLIQEPFVVENMERVRSAGVIVEFISE